jgi:hypothetical protein
MRFGVSTTWNREATPTWPRLLGTPISTLSVATFAKDSRILQLNGYTISLVLDPRVIIAEMASAR